MFRPPTDGYVEAPIGETVIEHLQPRPTVKAITAPGDLVIAGINTNDVIMVEPTSTLVDKAIVLLRKDGETVLAKLHQQKGKWCAATDTHKGVLTENIEVVARVSAVIKDQL